MTLQAIRDALEAGGKADLVKDLNSHLTDLESKIEAEKNRGISEVSKKNKEASGLRQFKKALEGIGFNSESDSLESFTGALKDKIKASEETVSAKGEVGELSQKLAELTRKMEASEQKAIDAETARKASEERAKKSQLFKELKSSDIGKRLYNADDSIEVLIAKGKVDIDGESVVFRDGDDIIDFNTGVANYLDSRKDSLKPNQSGGNGGAGGGALPDGKTMRRADFDGLAPAKQAAHFKDGGSVVD